MDFLLLIGRIVLVVMFASSGLQKFGDISGTAAEIASKGLPAPQLLAIAAGATEVIGAALIIVGWKTRWVAVVLMLFTAVAGYFFHDFWNYPEGAERMDQMVHAMKNLSIIGAFLLLAGAGAGRYSIDGVSRRAI